MKTRMKILIGYDGSECADAALDDLKKRFEAGLCAELCGSEGSIVRRRACTIASQDKFSRLEVTADSACGSPAWELVFKSVIERTGRAKE